MTIIGPSSNGLRRTSNLFQLATDRSFPSFQGPELSIASQAQLDKPRLVLEVSDVFLGAPPRRYPFWAHMTIAEFVSVQITKQLVRDLEGERAPTGSFVCDHLSYVLQMRNSTSSNGEVSSWARNESRLASHLR